MPTDFGDLKSGFKVVGEGFVDEDGEPGGEDSSGKFNVLLAINSSEDDSVDLFEHLFEGCGDLHTELPHFCGEASHSITTEWKVRAAAGPANSDLSVSVMQWIVG